ncbi:hypothetical protein [Demequina capsici]|uniref:Uncharacterized protein n=1 Tax=Demequina capsici TaxID=3075620 RepID=A0AA96J7K6_9MICO|nr:hypothetical protein [Demequina sp. OYTSA14]WNM25287.1 hypothetical protein RN606_03830 [Demequina sp. OYTSA14]
MARDLKRLAIGGAVFLAFWFAVARHPEWLTAVGNWIGSVALGPLVDNATN